MARQYFVIKTPIGLVSRFSAQHECVQVSMNFHKFVSYASAQKFIDTYADMGYGLNRNSAVILPFTK